MKTLLFLLLLATTAKAQTEMVQDDSYTIYCQNLALDYNRSDAVLLVKINECTKEKINDSLYRIGVSAKEIKGYKGFFDSKYFHFDATQFEVNCFEKDQITGIFLTQTDPKLFKQPYYKMLQYSGFTVDDTVIIKQFGNEKILAKYIKQSAEYGEALNEEAKWITAKVVAINKPSLLDYSFNFQKIKIQPTKNYPKARMEKGKIYTIAISPSDLGGYTLKNLLQKNNTYEFPIWLDVGFATSNIEFILEK